MRLAALFSGGKDSTYAIYAAKNMGHDINCLVTIFPKSAESHLLHHPNIQWTKLQSNAMKIPQLTVESVDEKTYTETNVLAKILANAKQTHKIEGLVHGGIKSNFQKEQFEKICNKLNLKMISPLWQKQSEAYMDELLLNNFQFVITSVSTDGLDDSWLGRQVSKDDLVTLKYLSNKYSFNLDFEGGEAETFVVNCPLFSNPVKIKKGEKIWDGYRGRFEIVEAGLDNNAR